MIVDFWLDCVLWIDYKILSRIIVVESGSGVVEME